MLVTEVGSARVDWGEDGRLPRAWRKSQLVPRGESLEVGLCTGCTCERVRGLKRRRRGRASYESGHLLIKLFATRGASTSAATNTNSARNDDPFAASERREASYTGGGPTVSLKGTRLKSETSARTESGATTRLLTERQWHTPGLLRFLDLN